jgi:glycerol kinase
MAYQSEEIFELMKTASGAPLSELQTDGGATRSDFLLGFQAKISRVPVKRAFTPEITALGAALLAAIGAGVLGRELAAVKSLLAQTAAQSPDAKTFEPAGSPEESLRLMKGWARAIEKAKNSVF